MLSKWKDLRTASLRISAGALAIASWMGTSGLAFADTAAAPGAGMAPVEQYLSKSAADEIASARTAAPPSIAADAEVLVLGSRGYEVAVKGRNGFVCLVERSWDSSFDSAGFWNPKIRGPDCFNAIAARSVLPQYLKRTEWALSGLAKEQMIERTRAAFAAGTFRDPEPGAMSFMLSKLGHIGPEAAGPWLPHVMIFIPHGQAAKWGAGATGSPVLGQEGSEVEFTVLYIPVRSWSDGSPAPTPVAPHEHT